ncbi:Demethylmenaquinone methyltransferase [Limihaloglobus sulfuriphilus]|uniref:Demethylmenaquinone methyltransferase n=1 Tax=Limihaloglobus sulfuriphilus TaxID=1851148 RepID=A0A1Q2MGX4_9BACT|nr:methyltransferase domain-containing protein [Limihaloglobus sulfuriphilus]AQQ71955.1 Demethylmenaquinone methyltransferase [Limihaloglobus sulfuriphilus]
MKQPFDTLANEYDSWYESPRGGNIFEAELKCLRRLCPDCRGRWLEVGVGTGRFASRMGIGEGLDPSPAMLALAAARGIKTYTGSAEELPFEADSFDGILIAFTLCFIAGSQKALAEAARVLKPGGRLLVGLVPAESPWGKHYQQKKENGHPIYSRADFLTVEKTVEMAEKGGFSLQKSASALFCPPRQAELAADDVRPGISKQAGFAAIMFVKPA